MSLDHVLPNWDNKSYHYDLEKHNWPAYWLNVAKTKFPQIESLETIHKVLSATEITELSRHLQSVCNSKEFIDKVDQYYNDIVPDLIDQDEYMIQRFFTVRLVIPNQGKVGRLLQFHKDEWTGNGIGILTVWTPITKCYESNSMQIVDTAQSDRISNSCIAERWDNDKIQEECLKYAQPVNLTPGEVFLFQQHHMHGNINNDTDITRWSMDGRILPKGGEYHRKLPGGYFRFIGEQIDDRVIDTSKDYISYAGWNNKWSSGIPLPMQRATINKYCNDNNIKINDYQFENEFLDWYPALEKFITGYNVQGIVMCSVYNLPDSPFDRFRLLQLAVENNVELHFANELCSVRGKEDIKKILKIFEYVK